MLQCVLMFEFEPEIITAKKCQGCGVQCEAGSRLLSLLFMKHMANRAGESLIGEDGQAFDAMIDEQVPTEFAEEIKQSIRKMVGEDMSDLDQRIDEAKQDKAANELACDGVLKMRASKGDVTYTVNVCTSPRVYLRDGNQPDHLPAHVRAESNNIQN